MIVSFFFLFIFRQVVLCWLIFKRSFYFYLPLALMTEIVVFRNGKFKVFYLLLEASNNIIPVTGNTLHSPVVKEVTCWLSPSLTVSGSPPPSSTRCCGVSIRQYISYPVL